MSHQPPSEVEQERAEAERQRFERVWAGRMGNNPTWLARADEFGQGDRLSYCEWRTRDAYFVWQQARAAPSVLLAAKEPETPNQPDSFHVVSPVPTEGPKTALSDAQIDAIWLNRRHLRDGQIMPQLRDFARAILAAAKG